MDETKKKLKTLESKWLEMFFHQLEIYFSEVHLPSHDQWHHYRVWQFVKSILAHLEQKGILFNSHELTNLMLASFFHDVGLTKTVDEWHGKAGADICRNFIESAGLNPTIDFLPALNAIEKHDDKQYKHIEALDGKPSILLIISTADDLDAFGYIGIVRYAEIYMLRNTSIENIPDKVIKNARLRFSHFGENFQHFEQLKKHQVKRYQHLLNFYRSVKAHSPSNNHNRNILAHIQKNVKKPHNNKSLIDLLKPIDSDHIESFKNEITKEQREFRNYSMDRFT